MILSLPQVDPLHLGTIIPSGRNAYVTRLGVAQSTGIVHIVLKGYWTWVEDSAVWVEEQEPFKVVVDKESFASGVTKKAVKVCPHLSLHCMQS
jgi:hypothetical protein